MTTIPSISAVAEITRAARRVLFITGAGVSAGAGIPTFRGDGSAYPGGITNDGVSIEQAFSHSALMQDPEAVWTEFHALELGMRGKQPGAAHLAIQALDNEGRNICVATQNVDGLHQRAGSSNVIELHGNLHRLVCTVCDRTLKVDSFERLPRLPRCASCGGLLRPAVTLYGEKLHYRTLLQLSLEQQQGFDAVFSVGTSSLLPYVVRLVRDAARKGIPTIEINPDVTPVSALVRFRFAAPAEEILPPLEAAVRAAAPANSGQRIDADVAHPRVEGSSSSSPDTNGGAEDEAINTVSELAPKFLRTNVSRWLGLDYAFARTALQKLADATAGLPVARITSHPVQIALSRINEADQPKAIRLYRRFFGWLRLRRYFPAQWQDAPNGIHTPLPTAWALSGVVSEFLTWVTARRKTEELLEATLEAFAGAPTADQARVAEAVPGDYAI